MDYLNRKRERNIDNTEKIAYNCGGYAFETYSWYLPAEGKGIREKERNLEDFVEILYEDKIEEEEIRNMLLFYCSDHVLKDFPNLRIISEEDLIKLPLNIKVIALRVFMTSDDFYEAFDYDLHFKIRKNGIWSHKRGSLDIENCNFDNWNDKYDSDIIYFIDKT